MTRDDVQKAIARAVDRGELPPGGPSEAAARGLLDELPPGYWSDWSEAAADRIRAQLRPAAPARAGEGPRPGGAAGPARVVPSSPAQHLLPDTPRTEETHARP